MTTTEPVMMQTRRRRRAWVVAILVIAAVVGSWLTYRAWSQDWPSRMVLVLDKATWPLAFSPDGKTLLTSGREGIIPWDVATGEKGKPWTLGGDQRLLNGAYSPDGRSFVVITVSPYGGDFRLLLFDVASGQSRVIFEDLENPTNSMSAPRFSVGGRSIRATLAGREENAVVVTWDVATGRETSRRWLRPWMSPTRVLSIEPDGRCQATFGNGSFDVEIRDVDADRWIGLVPAKSGDQPPACLAFSRDRKMLAIGRVDGNADVRDVANLGVAKLVLTPRDGCSPVELGFSADERLLLMTRSEPMGAPTGTFFGNIREQLAEFFPSLGPSARSEVDVIEIATGKTLAKARDSIQFLISPDGRTVATLGLDGTVKLRELPKAGR